ncbi:MAG TPA: type II secretion system protein [Chthoniobacterales bacterium]|nr:type II secretion system protein [Chthoniobacterales bacterium]
MKGRRGAFTLIELMIVASIIALVAVMALPSFLRARQRAQNTKFINALRVASGAFDTYAIEHGNYPPDVFRGIVPPGMGPYFQSSFDFTGPTPIGGQWDWDKDVFGFKAGLSVVSPNALHPQLRDIDTSWDDGNLVTGHFQEAASSRYSHILE